MKKSVLVVETYGHPKVLENVFHLLKNNSKVSFLMNKDKHSSYALLFPSSKYAEKVYINKLHSSMIFIPLLFLGRKFDYINISTGPEGSHFSEIINILFFYLCCMVYRKKIILTIKNLRPYLETTPGLFSLLRNKAIYFVSRFTFETKTMKSIFSENYKRKNILLSTSYDRYTDLNTFTKTQTIFNEKNKIKIGLLGVLDPSRRDYSSIVHAINNLNPKVQSKLMFVTLGACFGGNDNDVVKMFPENVKIDFVEGFISSEDFEIRGANCDLLISPLLPEQEYGNFKGSGSLGDALLLRKNYIAKIC